MSDYVTIITSPTDSASYLFNVYSLDATSNNITFTLQDINYADGMFIRIGRADNTTNTVTIMGYGGQLINGLASLKMYPKSVMFLNSFNNNWFGQVLDSVKKVTILKDEKSSGTNGGTFTSGSWEIRTLNAQTGNFPITLSSNTFTLELGSYLIEADVPAFGVGNHQARLYNVTSSSVASYGTSEVSGTSTTRSKIVHQVTILTPTVFRIEHQCSLTGNNIGFGVPSIFGNTEVYTTVQITRL